MEKISAFFQSIPYRKTIAILATLVVISQGATAVQGLFDSRYQKREDAVRFEAQAVEIIKRLDRMESKIDRLHQ